MPLTPHEHVHPVRRIIGLLLLLAAIIALFVVGWNEHRLADRIEATVQGWMDEPGDGPLIR